MSAQLSYSYQTPRGVAGGLYDISPYSINSRVNGETEFGKLKFGMGAVQGDSPGSNVKVPTSADTVAKFEGLVLTGHVNEMDMSGDIGINSLQTVGMLRWGKAWARVEEGITVNYGDELYLINDGANAGLFTNESGTNLAINGRFIGGLGTGNIAPVELHNQKPQ
ncbi:MAG: hypothetical protein LBS21_01555 [Clostridiales bacterium]|jgi:hypothetical protein|nr:hypothetical protein [Clostridiales bacterium]